MCLRDGACRCSCRGARCPAWQGRRGGRRPSSDVASGGADGSSGGVGAASADATAATDAGTTPDAAATPDATAAADAAAQRGRHAGAAAKFSAAQHGRHAEHVAAIAAECRRSASPRNAAAARHGIAASWSRVDGAGWDVWPRCWRHEPAGGIAWEYRWDESARLAAWWRTGWAQSARWAYGRAKRRRRQSAWRWFC